MVYTRVLKLSLDIYKKNMAAILPFVLALLVSLPLALILPNFVSASGIFVRYESLQQDFNWISALIIVVSFLLSLLLFTFAIVAINLNSLTQRTSTALKSWEMEALEEKIARLFVIFFLFFVFSFFINLILFEFKLHYTLGLIVSLVLSAAITFTPQAVVLDELAINAALKKSASLVFGKPLHVLFVMGVGIVLVLANTSFFLLLDGVVPFAALLSVIVNAVFILPFLEVVKTQVYLSKYSLI